MNKIGGAIGDVTDTVGDAVTGIGEAVTGVAGGVINSAGGAVKSVMASGASLRNRRYISSNIDPEHIINEVKEAARRSNVEWNIIHQKKLQEFAYDACSEYAKAETNGPRDFCDCVHVVAAACAAAGAEYAGPLGAALGADAGYPVARLACGRIYRPQNCD
ncbi:hypothetical protein COJ70_24395 [Priestia megaterium]|uniref:hypothetical protein n=1 Tax=Priestia megaterium TaxID=1404 RepID=UPI000BF82D6E|nr:hypothetical protein [Priestia megaterium]PFO12712.1 hypothetical protein COJ70_24395 [Priestia megaterium]